MSEVLGNGALQQLEDIAAFTRAKALETIVDANNGHIGGNLSSVELLTGLYFSGLFNFDPDDSKNEGRDRVLIRGHEGPTRYTIFALLGYIDKNELPGYRSLGSRLQGHEDMDLTPGVDITPSGSLGMLLSYGVGSAIANKDKGLDARTIVFLGDGEEQEGNVSEAARHGATLGLDNLICIIDKNQKQLSRPTHHSDGKSDLSTIWRGYGWNVLEIQNGHDLGEIIETYQALQSINSPTVVIANTIKGYGVTGAEDHFSGYHTLSAISDKNVVPESLSRLKKDLEDKEITYEKTVTTVRTMVSPPKPVAPLNTHLTAEDFQIHTNTSGINLEQAQEMYVAELGRRILRRGIDTGFYFVTPDLLRSDIAEKSGLPKFSHFIDTGIREQHAIAMSHGISVEHPGARIYVCYGDAFAYRASDQMHAAATGGSNIMIVGENAGIFQGQNGKTHQSVGQPGALQSMPELDFYEPADAVDLHNIFSYILGKNKGVSYVRFHRGTVEIEREDKDHRNHIAYFVHQPEQAAQLLIMSSGFTAQNAVNAAKTLELEHGIPTSVTNVVAPNKLGENIIDLIKERTPIVTVYNGSANILASRVAHAILSNPDTPRPDFIAALGYEAGTTGSVNDLIKHFGFDAPGITNFSLRALQKWKKR